MFEFSKLPLELQLKILIRLNFEDYDNFLENLEGYYKELIEFWRFKFIYLQTYYNL